MIVICLTSSIIINLFFPVSEKNQPHWYIKPEICFFMIIRSAIQGVGYFSIFGLISYLKILHLYLIVLSIHLKKYAYSLMLVNVIKFISTLGILLWQNWQIIGKLLLFSNVNISKSLVHRIIISMKRTWVVTKNLTNIFAHCSSYWKYLIFFLKL